MKHGKPVIVVDGIKNASIADRWVKDSSLGGFGTHVKYMTEAETKELVSENVVSPQPPFWILTHGGHLDNSRVFVCLLTL